MDPLTGPPEFATSAIGGAALRAWLLKLHQVFSGTGAYVAHVPLTVWIGAGAPESQASTIVEHYWDIYSKRDGPEHSYAAR